MEQPLYLEHNGIKDSLVEIGIVTNYRIQHLNEILITGLNLKYENAFNLIPIRERKNSENGDTIIVENAMCASDTYKVQVSEDKISFDIVEHYTGWADYSAFIFGCIDILQECLLDIVSVEVRYISTFNDVSIFDNVAGIIKLECYPRLAGSEFNFQFGIPGQPSRQLKGAYAIVRLKNNIPTLEEKGSTSVVDVQVIANLTNYGGLTRYKQNLENIHSQEKNIFYSLLSDSFIQSLKPHYANQ